MRKPNKNAFSNQEGDLMNLEQEEKQKQEGFSLIEILVAVMILAVSILGIMAVLPSGYKEITSAGRMSTLNHLAQLKIDQLKATPWNSGDLIEGNHPASPWRPSYTDADGNNPYSGYTVTWYVKDNVPKAGMKSIQVEAGWQLYNSSDSPLAYTEAQDQRKVRLVTYLNQ